MVVLWLLLCAATACTAHGAAGMKASQACQAKWRAVALHAMHKIIIENASVQASNVSSCSMKRHTSMASAKMCIPCAGS